MDLSHTIHVQFTEETVLGKVMWSSSREDSQNKKWRSSTVGSANLLYLFLHLFFVTLFRSILFLRMYTVQWVPPFQSTQDEDILGLDIS